MQCPPQPATPPGQVVPQAEELAGVLHRLRAGGPGGEKREEVKERQKQQNRGQKGKEKDRQRLEFAKMLASDAEDHFLCQIVFARVGRFKGPHAADLAQSSRACSVGAAIRQSLVTFHPGKCLQCAANDKADHCNRDRPGPTIGVAVYSIDVASIQDRKRIGIVARRFDAELKELIARQQELLDG